MQSPFERQRASIDTSGRNRRNSIYWAVGIACLLTLIAGAIFFSRITGDPLRMLKEFPISEYYDNHAGLEGTRFKATLKPKSQIGFKEGVGRLIIFEIAGTDKPVVILISPSDNDISFDNGKLYRAELQVGEGGLVKASNITKG